MVKTISKQSEKVLWTRNMPNLDITVPLSFFSPPQAMKPECKGTIASPRPIRVAKVNLNHHHRAKSIKLSKHVTLQAWGHCTIKYIQEYCDKRKSTFISHFKIKNFKLCKVLSNWNRSSGLQIVPDSIRTAALVQSSSALECLTGWRKQNLIIVEASRLPTSNLPRSRAPIFCFHCVKILLSNNLMSTTATN